MNALVSLKWIMLVYGQKLTHSFTNEWHKKFDSFTKMFCPIQIGRTGPKAGRTNSRTNCQQNRIAISLTNWRPPKAKSLPSSLFFDEARVGAPIN
jgi:hypothetical protein